MYKDELLGKVTTFMGGRAPEMLVCEENQLWRER